jgi:hypothetical protein
MLLKIWAFMCSYEEYNRVLACMTDQLEHSNLEAEYYGTTGTGI